MPAAAHAATSGSPWCTYGPTVVASTRVACATTRSDPASVTSAVSSGSSARVGSMPTSRSRTAASFAGLRPASAQRNPAGACRARYSAVSPPVKPVAPNRTMSYARSWGIRRVCHPCPPLTRAA